VSTTVVNDQPSKGLSTQVGLLSSAILGVVAIVTAILNGDHSSETIASLAAAVFTLCTTIGGRMYQAAQLLRGAAPYVESASSGFGPTEIDVPPVTDPSTIPPDTDESKSPPTNLR
jgi:hypothetical protein